MSEAGLVGESAAPPFDADSVAGGGVRCLGGCPYWGQRALLADVVRVRSR